MFFNGFFSLKIGRKMIVVSEQIVHFPFFFSYPSLYRKCELERTQMSVLRQHTQEKIRIIDFVFFWRPLQPLYGALSPQVNAERMRARRLAETVRDYEQLPKGCVACCWWFSAGLLLTLLHKLLLLLQLVSSHDVLQLITKLTMHVSPACCLQ